MRFDTIAGENVVSAVCASNYLKLSHKLLVDQLMPGVDGIASVGGDCVLDSDAFNMECSELLVARTKCLERRMLQTKTHKHPPMGIGARAAGLKTKCRAMVFGAWLERDSPSVDDWCVSIQSLTTDLGTESGTLQFMAMDWRQLMPSWLGLGLVADDAGAATHDPGAPTPAFPSGILVPGMLHIVNNMTLAVDQALSNWTSWLDGLRVVVKLLSVGDYRRRFVATCLRAHPLHSGFEPLFKADIRNITDWRWAIVSAVLGPLMRLRVPLQTVVWCRSWCSAKLTSQKLEHGGLSFGEHQQHPTSIYEMFRFLPCACMGQLKVCPAR